MASVQLKDLLQPQWTQLVARTRSRRFGNPEERMNRGYGGSTPFLVGFNGNQQENSHFGGGPLKRISTPYKIVSFGSGPFG